MTIDFISRMVGMVVFALLGARFGADAAPALALDSLSTSIIFALVGILVGLILTPWLTIRPIRGLRHIVNEMAIDVLVLSMVGLLLGFLIALLAAFPLSLLQRPLGDLVPAVLTVVAGYLGMTIFNVRSREIWGLLDERGVVRRGRMMGSGDRSILLDTSVLIDGRIVDIARTGFLGGTLVLPRFVISELHQVADSSDPLRRSRGRHGLEKMKQLQNESLAPFKIIEDDIPHVSEVDDKLVQLAMQLNAPIITNDFPLNRVAETQGVVVLNINALANALRPIYVPGDKFPIRIIQEGREENQGIGYLEDGTMIVVEGGKSYMDRTITVEVTKFINREAGRMFFAVPEKR